MCKKKESILGSIFKMENLLVGLPGFAISSGLFAYGQISQIPLLTSVYLEITLVILAISFFCYLFGGWRTGLMVLLWMSAIVALNLIPQGALRGAASFLLLIGFVLVENYGAVKRFLRRRFGSNAAVQVGEEQEHHDATGEETLAPPCEGSPMLYLIKPNSLKPDAVYQAFVKDGMILFCKVGGQFYYIDETAIWSPESPVEQILGCKGNYAICLSDVSRIVMNDKQSRWTGHIENSGTVRLTVDGKVQKYIIHPVQTFDAAESFIRNHCRLIPEVSRQDDGSEVIEAFTSQEYPESMVAKVKGVAKFLSAFAFITGLWLMLIPVPYVAAIAVNVLVVMAAYYLYIRYHSFIRIAGKEMNSRLNLMIAMLFPPLALCIRALMDFNLLYHWEYFVGILAVSLVASLFILGKTTEHKRRKLLRLGIPVMVLILVFGLATLTNCMLDFSEPDVYLAKVLDKDVSSGKTTTYELTLEPWADLAEETIANVDREMYERVEVGQQLYVYRFQGLWGMQWYFPHEHGKENP